MALYFPSQSSKASLRLIDLPTINAIMRGLLSKEREWILGEKREIPELFFNKGSAERVAIPLNVKEILWDMHNHPTGRRMPSFPDLKSARFFQAEEMGVIDPVKKRLLSLSDPNRFNNLNISDTYPSYFRPLFGENFWKLPLPLLQAIRDPIIRNMVNSKELAIQDIPLSTHPLFKNWLQLLKRP